MASAINCGNELTMSLARHLSLAPPSDSIRARQLCSSPLWQWHSLREAGSIVELVQHAGVEAELVAQKTHQGVNVSGVLANESHAPADGLKQIFIIL
ncbi:hypothetical protein EON65_24910 [archaeon]|nr:MAG: hypothetical protein EON65_24910 [archaeon]